MIKWIVILVSVGGAIAAYYFDFDFPNKEKVKVVAKNAEYAQRKARQSEAKSLLAGLYVEFKLEELEKGSYSEISLINFLKKQPEKTDSENYTLSVHHESCPDCGITAKTFKVVAAGNIDEDEVIDVWTIDHLKNLVNVVDDSKN